MPGVRAAAGLVRLGAHGRRMGLGVYVGPLTRYHMGDWLLIAQQAGEQLGMKVTIVRTRPEPADAITDPAAVLDAVLGWQSRLCAALGGAQPWAERAGLPYWTDKPGWDGYGGLVLLAAYDERPDLRPEAGEDPGEFASSPAYAAAAGNPQRYPSLLGGVEWRLPVSTGPAVFQARRPDGKPARVGQIGHLLDGLQRLNHRALGLGQEDLRAARRDGPPAVAASVQDAGRFGLAIMLSLGGHARQASQPLLLDY